jgi:ATP phosphoribosyltransferase
MKPRILIGAGKGRLLPVLGRFLTELGLDASQGGRKLVYEVEGRDFALQIAQLRWEDIRKNYNKFDMITYGADQWLEGGHKAMIGLRYYPQGDCRLSLLAPAALARLPWAELVAGKRVATSYPNLAREYLGVPEERIVRMTGSVETAVGLGWADCAFDVIESGATARANGLVEVKSCVKFGALVATCRPEKIPLLVHLRLIPPLEDAASVAFDGNDGTGKSTLARHLVQCGLWNDRPAVLVAPYSGNIGRSAEDLRRSGMSVDWASVVGRNHWRAPRQITSVYDRSLLTCLTDLLDGGTADETVRRVAETWRPHPAVTFLCQAPPEVSLARIGGRGTYDEFAVESALRKYDALYRRAAAWARATVGLKVIELDTTSPLEEVLGTIKGTLRRGGLIR